jgi:hypothetical protein
MVIEEKHRRLRQITNINSSNIDQKQIIIYEFN